MNVYDFDNTIYKGDSTLDFYKFCIKKNPFLLRYIFLQIYALVLYILNIYNKTEFKEKFYCFLRGVKNTDDILHQFWQLHKHKISSWYIAQKESTDVIISAAPEFLLYPIANELGFKLIASKVCKETGKYTGSNCYGEEKVRRFFKDYPDGIIKNFYSDSFSDKYIAEIAQNSYMIVKSRITVWNFLCDVHCNPFKSREFLSFLLVGVFNMFNGILFSSLLSFFLNANTAFISGYVLNISISYILNTKITFLDKISFKGYIKFIISYIPNFIIQNIVVIVTYNYMSLSKFISYILAAAIGVPITFVLLKLYVYTHSKGK